MHLEKMHRQREAPWIPARCPRCEPLGAPQPGRASWALPPSCSHSLCVLKDVGKGLRPK